MQKVAGYLRRNRSALLVGALRALTYLSLTLLFFGLMSVNNWPLRHLSRTLASTLLTWGLTSVAMLHIYGGYDVGRKKSKPIISSMALGVLCVDLVTYLQLQIMNVNPDNNAHLTIFGSDFLWLTACFILQALLIVVMVRLGNRLYFRLHQTRSCLLILNDLGDAPAISEKIGVYRLQWQVRDTALWSDPQLPKRIEAADVVFLANIPDEVRMRLLKVCYDLRRDVLCKAQLQDIMLSAAQPLVVDDALFLEMDYHKMTATQRAVKRLMDIFISLAALIVLSPLLLLISVAILLDDGRPVLFRQERITTGGRRFTIRKFRTMKRGADQMAEPVSEQEDDPRITRVGHFLRKWRLDELPQLWNILVGDMTLVGPRPEMLSNVEKYKSALPTFVYREKVKAGLTGYAQIEGRYNTSPEDKLMLDLMYAENFSLWNDVRLLFRTLTVFFKKDSTAPFGAESNTPSDDSRKDDPT